MPVFWTALAGGVGLWRALEAVSEGVTRSANRTADRAPPPPNPALASHTHAPPTR